MDIDRTAVNTLVSAPNIFNVPQLPGMTFLGSGCSRIAYLHSASRTVYKVGGEAENENEIVNAERLRTVDTGMVNIPDTATTHEPRVIIMQYVDFLPAKWCSFNIDEESVCKCSPAMRDRGVCFSDAYVDVCSYMSDLHTENLVLDKNFQYWLIDMGGKFLGGPGEANVCSLGCCGRTYVKRPR